MLPFSPTARGWALIFLCVASLGVSLANVNLAAGLTAASFFALLCASLAMSLMSIGKIDLWRSPGSDCHAGTWISLPVTVRNRGRFTRQAFVIRENLPFSDNPLGTVTVEPLGPGETRLVHREFKAVRRGSYRLERIYLVGGDPAGLFRRVKSFRTDETLTVYPEMFPVSWMPVFRRNRIQASTSGGPIGVSGLGEDFFGVREYRRSDSMRFIHWKASARQRRLMVREFEAHSSETLCVILDSDRRRTGLNPISNNFEHLVKTAASICGYIGGMHCQAMFISRDGRNGETIVLRGAGGGLRRDILDLLALIQTSSASIDDLMEDSIPIIPPNAVVYCLTLSEGSRMPDHFDSLLRKGADIRWICAPMENFIPSMSLPAKARKSLMKYNAVQPEILDASSSISKVIPCA